MTSQSEELYKPWTWQELQVKATNAVHRSVKDYAKRLLKLPADRWEHLLGHIPSDQAAQDPYPQYEVTDAQADAIADGALKRLRGPRKYNRTNVRAAVNIALATRRRQQQQLAGLPADAEDVGGTDGGGADGNGNGGGVGGAGPVDVDGREVGGEGQGHGGGKNTRGVQEIPNDPNPGILDPDDDPNSPFTPARFWRSLSSPRYDLRSGGGSGSGSSTTS